MIKEYLHKSYRLTDVYKRQGQRICGSIDTVVLDGSYSTPTTGIIWSTTGSGSFVPNVNDTNARYILSDNDRVSDSIKIYITSLNDPSGLCGNGKDSMTLIIDSAAIVDAGPDQTVCACLLYTSRCV